MGSLLAACPRQQETDIDVIKDPSPRLEDEPARALSMVVEVPTNQQTFTNKSSSDNKRLNH
jgi:hypothetical protein